MSNFEIIRELPSGSTKTFSLPDEVGKKGIMVRFQGQKEWIGIFTIGGLTSRGKSGCFKLRNESNECLVLSNGEGYIVNPDHPGRCDPLGLAPVMWAEFFPEPNLLVLITPWVIRSMRGRSVAWETGRISLDGINVKSYTDKEIIGSVDTLEGEDRFKLSLSNGHLEGVKPLDID